MRSQDESESMNGGAPYSGRGRGTSWRRLLGLAGLAVLAAAVSSASCGKSDNYQYIDVNVFADQNTVTKMGFATQIVSCEMYVTGSETSSPTTVPCMPTQQSYPNLGTFEWTTKLGKGSLQFTVTLFGLNRVVFAMGTSEPVTLGTGQKLTADVVAVLVPGAMTGTGGAPGGTGGGAGAGGGSGGGGMGGATGLGGAAGGAQGHGGMSGAGGGPGTGGVGGGGAGGTAGQGGKAGAGGGAGGAGGSRTGAGGSLGGAGGRAGAGGAAGSEGGAGGS